MNTELHDAITTLREQIALIQANWASNRLALTVRDLIRADEELGRVIDSQFDYYLLTVEGDCYPELMGPMACDAHRVIAARDMRAGGFDGGLYRVTAPAGTPITVESFGGAEIDEEEPPAPEPEEPEVLKLGGAMREIPITPAAALHPYTVLGFYLEDSQLFAHRVLAPDANAAFAVVATHYGSAQFVAAVAGHLPDCTDGDDRAGLVFPATTVVDASDLADDAAVGELVTG